MQPVKIVISQVMMPNQANPSGNVHGGEIMKLMDSTAYAAARKYSRTNVVTARVDELEFLEAKDRDCDCIFRKQELLEFSICCVPANPFALNQPTKKLEIERVIEEDNSSFYEKVCSGLKARA